MLGLAYQNYCGSLEPIKENLKVWHFVDLFFLYLYIFIFLYCDIKCDGIHIFLSSRFVNWSLDFVEIKSSILWIANKRKLIQIFDFVHNIMDVPHSLIAKFPQVHII